MQSAALFIGIGAIALVVLYYRFHPKWRVEGDWPKAAKTTPDVCQVARDVKAAISSLTNKYRKLSLVARTGVALVCFERYCHKKNLRHPMIDAFLVQMWEVPCMKSLPEWESRARECELVSFALGGDFPDELRAPLDSAGVNEDEFRQVVENCAEIFYCSAYAGTDNVASLQALDVVLNVTANAGVTPPLVEPFLLSPFSDAHGWGKRVSLEQRDQWRLTRA